MSNLLILATIFRIYVYESLVYLFGFTDKTTYIRNLINRVSKCNVLIIKIVQALMGFGLFSPEVVKVLKQNTHSVYVDDEDVDHLLLERIQKDYNIQLIGNTHFHSGMVAVVYLGQMGDKKIVIKLKRRNIKERICAGCDSIQFIYDFFNRFSVFSNTIKKIVLSLQSITKTNVFLISQCDFATEIDATLTTKREVNGYPSILQNIVIPNIYNNSSDIQNTNFIIMDYLDGVFSNDLSNANEQIEYFEILFKYFSLSGWLFTYLHTDMHCGNIIYMKDCGILKVGIIDYGMVVKSTDENKEGLQFLRDMYLNKITQREAFRGINYIVDNKLDLNIFNDEQQLYIGTIFHDIISKGVNGVLTEYYVISKIDSLSSVLNIDLVFNLDLFLILISSSMLMSSFKVLTNYDNVVLNKTINNIMTEFIE